jgi:hypothetical protein
VEDCPGDTGEFVGERDCQHVAVKALRGLLDPGPQPCRPWPPLERAITLYDPAEHRPLATRFGQNVGAATLSWKSLVHWLLGHPQIAVADSEQALEVARELTHSGLGRRYGLGDNANEIAGE